MYTSDPDACGSFLMGGGFPQIGQEAVLGLKAEYTVEGIFAAMKGKNP